tara:strand:+ start:92 stop:232 length:141 start_codon:yes stop_codon:yes gene_type:complete
MIEGQHDWIAVMIQGVHVEVPAIDWILAILLDPEVVGLYLTGDTFL